MREQTTYECRRCGNTFVVSEAGKRHLSPLYCCGEEVKKRKKSVKKEKPKKI
ncbi:MAG: hypothetical protein AB1632_11495 [Nitrospirota bacterium]